MTRFHHRIESDPHPESIPSPARISAAVARLNRRHARATDYLRLVFGEGSAAVTALARRVEALHAASAFDLPERASRLRQLTTELSAVAELPEAEDNDAAELHALLDCIVTECDFIAGASYSASAA